MTAPRHIVITGATDGIGLLLTQLYVARGADVIATGRRSNEELAEGHFDKGVTYVQADQADPATAAAVISGAVLAKGWTHIDAAILNAATAWSGSPAEEMPETIFRQVRVNLATPILIARELAPLILAGHGVLSLIGSTARRGAPGFATYSATKAGLHGFARSLREEWRGRAHVQVLHPGPTSTGMQEKAGFDDSNVRRFFVRPDRMAAAVQHAVEARSRSRKIGHSYCTRVSAAARLRRQP